MQHLEDAAQAALFQWAGSQYNFYPELRLLFAIPNGGKRDIITAVRLKQTGAKSGVSDMFLPVPKVEKYSNKTYHGLWVELKVGKNKPTFDQLNWLVCMWERGFAAAVCYGWDLCKDTIVKYLQREPVCCQRDVDEWMAWLTRIDPDWPRNHHLDFHPWQPN